MTPSSPPPARRHRATLRAPIRTTVNATVDAAVSATTGAATGATRVATHVATLFAALAAAACFHPAMAAPIDYPPTAKVEQTDTYFGTPVADPYRWLEDDNSPQTKAWVERQNALTFGWLRQIPFRADLLARIRALSNYERYSAPFQKNGKVFYFKNDGLQNQSVLYVQQGFDGKPEVLIDPNTFSVDGTVRLESFTLSRDGRYAAYAKTAIPGSDWRDIYVMDMATGRTLPDVLHWIKFSSAAWRGDGFYYSRFPEPVKGKELTGQNVDQKVYFHKIGTPQSDDALVYEDPAHPGYFVDVQTTEVRYLLGYSPLHNLKAGVNYPATLVTTSDHDDRVVPAHSFKYAATLQEKSGGEAPHLIRIETNSGHGSSNLSKGLEEAADVYAFIWANMGVVPVFPKR